MRLIVGPGDAVVIPAGEPHWHGATDSSSLVQLSAGIPGTSDFGGEAYAATK